MDRDSHSSSLSPGTILAVSKLHLPSTCEPPGDHNPHKQAVWIIFGATGHMGHSLVHAVLAHNDKVTAVGWTEENTLEEMERMNTSNCHGMLCDVRVRCTVDAVIKQSVKRWGRVDIIVNCTGYGVIGSCEDQDEHDLRNQFETNFFGTLHIIQLSLPLFRSQNHGRYLIFSSTAGALGVPGLGPYCATKYAVEGLIESMLYEIDIFNIKATLVEPGHVRLDEPKKVTDPQRLKGYGHFFVKGVVSEPYATQTAPAGHAKRIVQWLNNRQPTSAVKCAELCWQLGHCSYPPLRLLLGSYAVDSIRDRLRSIIEEIEDWKHLSFPVAPGEEGEFPKDDLKDDASKDTKEDQEDKEDMQDAEG